MGKWGNPPRDGTCVASRTFRLPITEGWRWGGLDFTQTDLDGWAMSAADQRLAELLDRWSASVELHARYLALDDDAYARVQDWPKHRRPSRWVVELARSRLLELKLITDERLSRGDGGFAEALELMALVTSLLGTEHIERFIPLAEPRTEPEPAAVKQPEPVRRVAPRPPGPPPVPTAQPARPTAAPSGRRSAPARGAVAGADAAPAARTKATATVIADAVRLISWGREWPQLAGLIARLADRPTEADVWTILRTHRAEIEAQARKPRG